MDRECTTGVQPDISEVTHVGSPVYDGTSLDDVMPVNSPPTSIEVSENTETDVVRSKESSATTDESSFGAVSETSVDGESELPESSMPSWLADEFDDEHTAFIPIALRHVKAKRGGDLLGIIKPQSNSDALPNAKEKYFLLVIIKGTERSTEWIRVNKQLIEISYRGQKEVEEDIQSSLYLPSFLRKARVLFERDGVASKICDMIAKRFRKGPSYASINEKIALKADCYYWLGKIREEADHRDHFRYILPVFIDQIVGAWFRVRGLWHVSLSEELA